MVFLEQRGVLVTEAVEEARRALDVGEEERDRAGGQARHGSTGFRWIPQAFPVPGCFGVEGRSHTMMESR